MVALVKNPHITRIFSSATLASQRPNDGARYGIISRAELTTKEAQEAQVRMDASGHKNEKREASLHFMSSFTSAGQISLQQQVQNDISSQANTDIVRATAKNLQRIGVFGHSGLVKLQSQDKEQSHTLQNEQAFKFNK